MGLTFDYMRVRGFPFAPAFQDFLDDHDTVFVVEQNRDAQLRSLLVLETAVPKDRLRSVLAYDGLPLSAAEVVDSVRAQMKPDVPSIDKPRIEHPGTRRNGLGLTIRDYEGSMSTLCAGCGHDSVTAAIVHALWEIETPPHRIANLSGI